MDSDDDDWDDVPLTRTVETGHIPLVVKRMWESPTVGIENAILLNRVNEKSDKLTFPNSHEHYYTKDDNPLKLVENGN